MEAKIRSLESMGSETPEGQLAQARSDREKRLESIRVVSNYLSRIVGPMNEQNGWLFTRTSRIYDFADLSQDAAALDFLTSDFWRAFGELSGIVYRMARF